MASLREGIKRLEQLRLVDVKHGDAMRVQDWRAHSGLDVLAYAVTVDPALTGALFEARRLLLLSHARLAAERRGRAHERALLELAEAFETAEDDAAAQLIDLALARPQPNEVTRHKRISFCSHMWRTIMCPTKYL